MAQLDRDRLTCIGILGQAHGIKGEIKARPLTDKPEFYEGCRSIVLATRGGLRAYQVTRLVSRGGRWILSLEGLTDRNGAEALKGSEMLVEDSELAPLGESEYFQHDLIGCSVETLQGQSLGQVEEIMETGANDVLVVSEGKKTVMVPLLRGVICEVDIQSRKIRIDPLPGLLDDDEA